MSLLSFFRRSKSDGEAERRARLLTRGRIAEGRILDISELDSGQITHIFFSYSINGVDYESSQTLDATQQNKQSEYAPGAPVTIRYDPNQPGNSVVV